MVKDQEQGISLTDLAGELVDVRVIDTQQTQKKGQNHLICEVEHNGSNVKFGVIGQNSINSVLKHGIKRDDGIYLKVPEKILKMTDEGKIQWINFEY